MLKFVRVPLAIAGLFSALLAFSPVAFPGSAAQEENPGAVNVDQGEVSKYRDLAGELGLQYGRDYSYREWRLDVLKQFQFDIPEVGDCGTWAEPKDCEQQAGTGGVEYIYCSHGRDNVGLCDQRGAGPHIETVYLTEKDVTLVTELRTDEPATRVKILKIEEGRHPQLHQS